MLYAATDASFQDFVKANLNATTLTLFRPQLSAGGFAPLAQLGQLTKFTIRHAPTFGNAQLALLRCPLEEVIVEDTVINGTGCESLAQIQTLQKVELWGLKQADAASALLTQLNLRRLLLTDSDLTDTGMKHIGGITTLEELEIGRVQITPASLSLLNSLVALRVLEFYGNIQLSDEHLGLLNLPGLTVLNIFETSVNGEGFWKLGSLPMLSTIIAGKLKYVAGLLGVKSLRQLFAQLRPYQVRLLQQSRPDLEVSLNFN